MIPMVAMSVSHATIPARFGRDDRSRWRDASMVSWIGSGGGLAQKRTPEPWWACSGVHAAGSSWRQGECPISADSGCLVTVRQRMDGSPTSRALTRDGVGRRALSRPASVRSVARFEPFACRGWGSHHSLTCVSPSVRSCRSLTLVPIHVRDERIRRE